MEVLSTNVQKPTIKDVISKNAIAEEAKNELNKLKKQKKWQTEKTQFTEQINVHIANEF